MTWVSEYRAGVLWVIFTKDGQTVDLCSDDYASGVEMKKAALAALG